MYEIVAWELRVPPEMSRREVLALWMYEERPEVAEDWKDIIAGMSHNEDDYVWKKGPGLSVDPPWQAATGNGRFQFSSWIHLHNKCRPAVAVHSEL
jgi:hypothetical protein